MIDVAIAAVAVDGKMVDRPVVLRAQAILADPGCWEWTEDAEPANVSFFFHPLVAQPA